MESERPWARAAIMREARNSEDAPSAERGWLDWLDRLRRAGDQRHRHARARPPHPRRRRDAGRRLPGARSLRERGARADRGRAADGRPGPRARRDAGGDQQPRPRRRPADRRDRHGHQGLDGPRAGRARRARRAASVHELGAGAARIRSRRGVPRQRPGRPGRALLRRRHRARRSSGSKPVWGICLGHQLLCRAVGLETFKLPFGHRGANHPVRDLATGRVEITSQNHGFAALGPGGSRTIDTDEPVRWETDFGAAVALAREPLRPHGRGPRAARRPRRHRAVPPRGRAGAARLAVPVRPLPPADRGGAA